MSKFKINSPLSKTSEEEEKAELFGRDAENHTVQNQYPPNIKPTKAFTVPMTEHELSLLQKIARIHDRSQRYMARKLLVKILKSELDNISD
jgi:hypothetical protein